MRRKNAIDTRPGTAYTGGLRIQKGTSMASDEFVFFVEFRAFFKDRLKRKTSYGRNEVLEEFDEAFLQVARSHSRRDPISDLSLEYEPTRVSTDEAPV